MSTKDYKRLQNIEENVVTCVDLAASIIEELAKVSSINEAAVLDMCKKVTTHIEASQKLIQEAVSTHVGERSFEANLEVYNSTLRASIAAQKVEIVSDYLKEAQKVLQKGMQVEEPTVSEAVTDSVPMEQ